MPRRVFKDKAVTSLSSYLYCRRTRNRYNSIICGWKCGHRMDCEDLADYEHNAKLFREMILIERCGEQRQLLRPEALKLKEDEDGKEGTA